MNQEQPINSVDPATLTQGAETPLEVAPEAAPVIETPSPEVDLLGGIEFNEEQEQAPQDDGSGMMQFLKDSVREGVQETLDGYRKPADAPAEDEKMKMLEAKLAQLEQRLEGQAQQEVIAREVQKSQTVLSTYIANVNAGLFNSGITTDNNPLLFKALNAELTAAVTLAEKELRRPLMPRETARLVTNFNKAWEPILVQNGLGKGQAPQSKPALSSVGGANFTASQPQKASGNDTQLQQIEGAESLKDLIKLGYTPTARR